MANRIRDAGSIQTAISAHQNLSDLPNIENDDNNDNLSSQNNPKNNSLSTQNIKLEIINSDSINKIKFPSELDPDPMGLDKHCKSRDTLLIKRCKSVDSLRSIESCESETHSDTSQLKSAVKRSKSHKPKSPKDTNEKQLLKKKTDSKTQIKSKFATRSIDYIQQNLGGKIFSGWIEERRWIDSIGGYRDVVQVDEWEIEINHQIKDITNSIPGVAEGTKWINITGPSESEPCCCLWVLMPTAPTPGHCWFQVTNILIEPLFGLRIQLRMIRNLHTHDGETMDARKRRRELLAKQGTSEAVAQGFSQQMQQQKVSVIDDDKENTPDIDMKAATHSKQSLSKVFENNSNNSNKANYNFLLSSLNDPEDKDRYVKIIEGLGGTLYQGQTWDSSVTHLVTVKPYRSEKILSAIASGRWVLFISYMEASYKAGKFVKEEDHEWGNPSAVNLPKFAPDTDEEKLGAAAHRWRTALTSDEECKGAFQNMRAIIHSSSKELVQALTRLLNSGNGEVIVVKPPYTEGTDITHFIVEQHKNHSKYDLAHFVSQKIPCLPLIYLSNYLIMWPTPDAYECCIDEYKKIEQDMSSRKQKAVTRSRSKGHNLNCGI